MESQQAGRRRTRRAAAACDFCRWKKLKCDTGQPSCQNCKNNGHECFYVPLAKKPRPSNERIANLEKENQRLREGSERLRFQLLHDGKSTVVGDNEGPQNVSTDPMTLGINHEASPVHSSNAAATSPTVVDAPDNQRTNCPGTPRSFGSQPKDNSMSYHGPTSAMFDEETLASPPMQSVGADQKMTTEWAQHSLLAEAARQRQCEAINLAYGNLDFDGVDAELAMHLLSIHWNRQHYTSLIVYRPAFMRDMACNGPYFSKLLLNTMYFGASKHSKRLEVRRGPADIESAGWMYRQRAVELLREAFDESRITTIQALLILASSLFSRCDERSTSWLHAGNAFNMIIDLGLQIDDSATSNTAPKSAEDLEIRRRVFWGAFVLDKVQSLYQGRPARLREADSSVSMTFLDMFEELQQFDPLSYAEIDFHPGTPLYNISVHREFCGLSVILDRILGSLYAVKSSSRNQEELFQESRSLQSDIDQWRSSLPPHLHVSHSGPVSPAFWPHTLSLIALSHVLVIMIHRPLVSDGHLRSSSPSIVLGSFGTCASAATEITRILNIYGSTFKMRSAPYLLSYATYIASTIHIRIAAQKGPESDAYAHLRSCLDALGEQSTLYSAARSAKQVVLLLMSRMGLVTKVGETTTTVSDHGADTNVKRPSNATHYPPIVPSPQPGLPVFNTTGTVLGPRNNTNLPASSPRQPNTASFDRAGTADFSLPADLDIEALAQSFLVEQEMAQQSSFNNSQQFLSPWDVVSGNMNDMALPEIPQIFVDHGPGSSMLHLYASTDDMMRT